MSARNSYNVAPLQGENNGGAGGGGGEPVGGGLPLGSIVLSALAGSSDPDWLVCDSTEYRIDTNNFQLFNAIGWRYSPNTAVETQYFGTYTYGTGTPNEITFNTATNILNQIISVGSFIKPYTFIATTGQDINGSIIRITSCPALNSNTTGVYTGVFVPPITGTGTGNAAANQLVSRWSYNVPDMTGRFPIGFNATYPRATTGGSATTTLTAANLPQHRHGTPVPGTSSATAGGGLRAGTFNVDDGTKTWANQTYLENGSTLAGNTAFNTISPYLAVNYIIKSTA